MSDGLKKLRKLTDSLPPFPRVVKLDEVHPSEEGTMYKMNEGACFAWYLFEKKENVGVHRWFNSKGCRFPLHGHKEREWVIVFKGEMVIESAHGKTIIYPGDCAYLEQNVKHSAYFPKDTEYITVMVPESKEYPHE